MPNQPTAPAPEPKCQHCGGEFEYVMPARIPTGSMCRGCLANGHLGSSERGTCPVCAAAPAPAGAHKFDAGRGDTGICQHRMPTSKICGQGWDAPVHKAAPAPAPQPSKWEVNKVSNGWVVGRYSGTHFQKFAKFFRREALDRFIHPECPTCAYTPEDLANIARAPAVADMDRFHALADRDLMGTITDDERDELKALREQVDAEHAAFYQPILERVAPQPADEPERVTLTPFGDGFICDARTPSMGSCAKAGEPIPYARVRVADDRPAGEQAGVIPCLECGNPMSRWCPRCVRQPDFNFANRPAAPPNDWARVVQQIAEKIALKGLLPAETQGWRKCDCSLHKRVRKDIERYTAIILDSFSGVAAPHEFSKCAELYCPTCANGELDSAAAPVPAQPNEIERKYGKLVVALLRDQYDAARAIANGITPDFDTEGPFVKLSAVIPAKREVESCLIDDQPVTPMPGKCLRWECRDAPPLKRERGFMVCPNCHASYGR